MLRMLVHQPIRSSAAGCRACHSMELDISFSHIFKRAMKMEADKELDRFGRFVIPVDGDIVLYMVNHFD